MTASDCADALVPRSEFWKDEVQKLLLEDITYKDTKIDKEKEKRIRKQNIRIKLFPGDNPILIGSFPLKNCIDEFHR